MKSHIICKQRTNLETAIMQTYTNSYPLSPEGAGTTWYQMHQGHQTPIRTPRTGEPHPSCSLAAHV